MTNIGMFKEANKSKQMKKFRARIKELMKINQDHQTINGKLRSELDIEKKNHSLKKS